MEVPNKAKSNNRKSMLARWATQWHDYQAMCQPTHPTTQHLPCKWNISATDIVGSYSNYKLKLRRPRPTETETSYKHYLQWKTNSKDVLGIPHIETLWRPPFPPHYAIFGWGYFQTLS